MLCIPNEEDILAGDQLPAAPTSACIASSGPEDESVDFHLGYDDWICLLRANGFDVEDLVGAAAAGGLLRRPPHGVAGLVAAVAV